VKNPFAKAKTSKTFALTKINVILGRAQAAALLLTGGEAIFHAFDQIQYLNSFWFYSAVILFSATVIGVQVSQWIFNAGGTWFLIHAVVIVVMLLSWRLQVFDPALLPEKYEPWIWWTLGMAGLSAVLSFEIILAVSYVVGLPILWALLRLSEWGGTAPWTVAWQEAAYTFLVSGTFGAVILLLRSQASNADLASELSAKASGDQARVDAVERERYRIDSLMHDKVFTTLILASQAKSPEDENTVAGLAQEAIQAINLAGREGKPEQTPLSVSSYFLSLKESISQAFSGVKVVLASGSDFEVPVEVAAAVTDATIQAVQNSVQHAGPASIERSVRLKAHHDGFKIVIVDLGKGFRVSRVAKDRLGVRLSIISKVEKVGGRVFIDSRIGEGTNVIIEWQRDA